MKKLVLFAVAIVAFTFASCGDNKPKDQPETQESTEVVATEGEVAVEEAVVDSTEVVVVEEATEAQD